MDKAGVQYRISVSGAIADDNGKLAMNVDFPRLPLQFMHFGHWHNFNPDNPPNASQVTAVRAKSADGSRVGRAISFP